MCLLITSIAINCLILIVSAQEEASANAVSSAVASTSPVPSSCWAPSPSLKPRIAAKVYNQCGTACPLTCASPKPRPCILICKEGWFCPQGYYENSYGQCVVLEDCDTDSSVVPKVYSQCGSACPATCENKNPNCITLCVPGLSCPRGYVQNKNDQCIRPENC